jgi:hypothetical protein
MTEKKKKSIFPSSTDIGESHLDELQGKTFFADVQYIIFFFFLSN